MAKNRGSKEGSTNDPSLTMPAEQRTTESIKKKIAKIREIFPDIPKDNAARILHYYDNDENQAIDVITKDGGQEAINSWVDSEKSKNKNNKNKKKRKKPKKDATGTLGATASFDADDSSSLHSGGNIEPDVDKDINQVENGAMSDTVSDLSAPPTNRLNDEDESLNNHCEKEDIPSPLKDLESTSVGIIKSLSEARSSPHSDSTDEQSGKKEKFRSNTDSYYKHSPRQRTNSFRRAKSSSISEDSSSQYNPQTATATPTKRGFEKCKKDLNRQAISLHRIQSQVEKGLDESEKKIKNVFADLQKMLENRQTEIELELTKTKLEALNLLKSRQDLAVDLKRRVDRTSQLSEAEWSELRADIKQFVTERKYDDELGRTIWFHWSDLSETIKAFGEVQPVKNVYTQRSHSIAGSSVTNENINSNSPSAANEIGSPKNLNDGVSDAHREAAAAAAKEYIPPYRNPSTLVYTNKKFSRSNNNGSYQGNHNLRFYPRGGGGGRGRYQRNNYGNHYMKNFDYNRNHPHQGRNDGTFFHGDRNVNPINKMDRGQRHGPHHRYNNYRNDNFQRHRMEVTNESEPISAEKSVVNGFVNDGN